MGRGKKEIYLTLAEEIRTLIRKKSFAPGERLPSEREFARQFSCNHLTVRKALKSLREEGVLHAVSSVGYFCGKAPEQKHILSDRIGFIFPDDEIFYYRIFAEFEAVISSAGFHPVLHLTGGSVHKERELLEYFERSSVRALVAAPNRFCTEQYRALRIPALFFDMPIPELEIPQIVSDDFQGAFNAVTYLIKLGHRRIAHIGCEYDYTGEQRLSGYLRALDSGHIARKNSLIRMRYPSREWGYHAIRDLFALRSVPTAVFCANDTIASGVLNYCADHSIAVPGELSVVGFGDTPTAEFLDLCSVNQNAGKISGALCENLWKLDRGEKVAPLTVIGTSLIIRKSAGPPAL